MAKAKKSSASAALAQASAALADGDEDVALDLLVDAWRAQPDGALADRVARLSARLEPHVAALGGKLDAFQAAWMAMARSGRAVYLPRLVSSVLETTHRFGKAVVAALIERSDVLAKWPADPRMPALVIEHLRRPGYESSSRSTLPFWNVLFALLRTQGDGETLEFLRSVRFARTFRSYSDGKRRIQWFQEQADDALAELQTRLALPTTQPPKAFRVAVAELSKRLASRETKKLADEVVERLASPPASAPRPRKPRPAAKRRTSSDGRTLAQHLARANKAKSDEARLAALLAAWRVAPAAELAQLVELVSQRVSARLRPIGGASRAAIHQAWLAVAADKDARDLPRLLRSITDTKGRSTDALERLQALAGWPADPRAGHAVLAQLQAPPFHSSSSRPFWSSLIEWTVTHGDRRMVDAFEALAERYDVIVAARYADRRAVASWFRRQLQSAAATLRALPSHELSAAQRAQIGKIAERIGDLDGPYLARIYADPENDEPRQAFADHLIERGDPRGELIALQLAAGDAQRVAALVGDHAQVWLGPLAPFVDEASCRFERGFVDHVEIAGFEPDKLGPALHDPIWTTVRSVHLQAVEAGSFRATPIMRCLRKVTVNGRRGRQAIRIVRPKR